MLTLNDPDRITPKGKCLLVRLDQPKLSETLEVVHEFLVPEKQNSKPEDRIVRGKVLKVGPKVDDVKPGDTLYFSQLEKKVLEGGLLLIRDRSFAFTLEH